MGHGDVCPLTENEGSRHQGEGRLRLSFRDAEDLLAQRGYQPHGLALLSVLSDQVKKYHEIPRQELSILRSKSGSPRRHHHLVISGGHRPWEPDRAGTRGAQRKYSDLAIESALTRRLLFHLPLRQAEGVLTALFVLMGLDLRAPDHPTVSRRRRHLDLARRRVPKRVGLHLIIDSSGLSIVGAGEWATAKHGRRGHRGWKKLHLGIDPTGVIVAHALTEATLDDATTGLELIATVNDDITRMTGDAADDTVAFYDTASARGATVVVSPAKTARVSPRGPRSRVRDRTIKTVKRIGRCRWKKTSRDQQQARVENAFFRYTSIIGEGLRAKTSGGRTAETLLACNILKTMTDMGRPNSCAIGR